MTPPTLVRAERAERAAATLAAPGEVALRPATARDVAGIVALIAGYAAEQVMLPRTPESVLLALDDFVVAVDAHGTVLGCGALKEYSPSLAEVSSLAVARAAHGRGLGRTIVARLERLARARGIGELFALTLTPEFFGAVGYEVVDRARYPEKIRRDCLGCARRAACREVCVARSVEVVEGIRVAA
ncbi:MAG: GNAT family N-acetyltransferase [Gemmatimonadaceae bacterium]